MKKILPLLCVVGLSASAVASSGKATLDQRLENSRVIINEIMNTPDQGIPNSIMKQATCVAVVPGLKKGAFIFGGQYGQGVVTCRTGHGWSAPAFIRMAGGSFGLQIGGGGAGRGVVCVEEPGEA